MFTKYNCLKHGRVTKIELDRPKFCPICGESAIPVFLIPRIYVTKGVTLTLCGILVAGLIGMGIGRIYVNYDRETERWVSQMAPQWRGLYNAFDESFSTDGVKELLVFQNYMKKNQDKLKMAPSLKDTDLRAIKRVISNDSVSQVVVSELSEYREQK